LTTTACALTDDRILGWDLLRGLCALAVALYHLLLWQDVAQLHAFGSYGVYLFFVLSGASLAYTYTDRFERGVFSLPEFLRVRYMRVAPLYLALIVVVLPWKLRDGLTWDLASKLVLNVLFLFGFQDPAVNSMLVGGWSLGIEAMFYLLFPLLLLGARSSRVSTALFAALVLLQAAWIYRTFSMPGGYVANATLYHQAPAFAAYFAGGFLIGRARLRGHAPRASRFGLLAAILAGFALLLLLNPAQPGDELVGGRGAILFLLCFTLVWLAGGLELGHGKARQIATHMGDSTYGLYLIHPVVFFGLAFVLLPKLGLPAPTQWSLVQRFLLAGSVIAVAFVLAILSERHFERPLRNWSKLRRRHPALQ
jgi:exopolysaccharide production protein ExoZ